MPSAVSVSAIASAKSRISGWAMSRRSDRPKPGVSKASAVKRVAKTSCCMRMRAAEQGEGWKRQTAGPDPARV